MAENTIKELKDFFGVDAGEMMEVWKTMSDEEKAEWKSSDLSK